MSRRGFPANIYVQSTTEKNKKKLLNMIKVNNKDKRTTSYVAFIVNLEPILHLFPNVSVVDFEQ